MISILVDLLSRLKIEKTAEIAACEKNSGFDNVVISSQAKTEVNTGREMAVAADNIPEKGSEKIFGTVVEVFNDEGVTVIDGSGRNHFVEACNIVACDSISKGDKVRGFFFFCFQ